MTESDQAGFSRLYKVAALFLKLGLTAFGGPAAHIAIMHEEVVKRRKWMDDRHFLDLLGATNMIPGPNSTEMAIHIGYVRAGWAGLILAGLCFILPATLIVLALAFLYVRYGSVPEASWILYGIKPVIIVIILQALWGLGSKAVKGPFTAIMGAGVVALYFLGVNEILLLFAGGLAVMVEENLRRIRGNGLKGLIPPFGGTALGAAGGMSLPAIPPPSFDLSLMFFLFLKIGSVLYGSGYVLLAFFRSDFVKRLGWLTDRQLVDAIAIGQLTPGPVSTTATFIGYLLGDVPGALLATLGIFLPSFIFVALSNPLIPRLRRSSWASGFLDGVNVASLGLMAVVTWELGRASITDPLTVLLSLTSLLLLLWFRINPTWLIIGGGASGLLNELLR